MIIPVPSEDSRTLLCLRRNRTNISPTSIPRSQALLRKPAELDQTSKQCPFATGYASKENQSCTTSRMIGHCLPAPCHPPTEHQRNVPLPPAVPARKEESPTTARMIGYCEDARLLQPPTHPSPTSIVRSWILEPKTAASSTGQHHRTTFTPQATSILRDAVCRKRDLGR
jgi:hypothetical protein